MIEKNFEYKPVAFSIGDVSNEAGQNEGSCKIVSFALLNQLDLETTLQCFGTPYRDVLADPEGDSHANIRALMQSGLEGAEFADGIALSPK